MAVQNTQRLRGCEVQGLYDLGNAPTLKPDAPKLESCADCCVLRERSQAGDPNLTR